MENTQVDTCWMPRVRGNYLAHKVDNSIKDTDVQMAATIEVRLSAVNVLASFYMEDAKQMLAKTPLFRQKVKQCMNKALDAYGRYENMLRTQNFGKNYNIWLDMTDETVKPIRQHVDMFQQAIWNNLVRNEVKNAELFSKLETARTMVEYACIFYDKICSNMLESTGRDYSKVYLKHRMTESLRNMNELTSIACKAEKKINFNEDNDCLLAFKAIDNAVLDERTWLAQTYNAFMMNEDAISRENIEAMQKFKEDKDREIAEEKERQRKAVEKIKKSYKKKRASDISQEDLDALKEKFNAK